MLDPDDLDNFIVHEDRLFLMTMSNKEPCRELLTDLQVVTERVLGEECITPDMATCRVALSDDVELSDRATKALHAYISIRQIRERERDALRDGPEMAERFYYLVHHAMRATLAATLVSPLISDYEEGERKLAVSRSKGGHSKNRHFREIDERVEAALCMAWARGARYPHRIAWANAIVQIDPSLAPPPTETYEPLSRQVSKIGRDLFKGRWPVKSRR